MPSKNGASPENDAAIAGGNLEDRILGVYVAVEEPIDGVVEDGKEEVIMCVRFRYSIIITKFNKYIM
jgi:hypothetical protein